MSEYILWRYTVEYNTSRADIKSTCWEHGWTTDTVSGAETFQPSAPRTVRRGWNSASYKVANVNLQMVNALHLPLKALDPDGRGS